jgi:hypothetical protein
MLRSRVAGWQGVLGGLEPQLILELAPLAAEFRLMGGAAGDCLRIVADQRRLAYLKTLGQTVEEREPLLDEVAELGQGHIHIRPSRQFRV